MARAVGAKNPYLWPKINGFHTQGALDQALRHLKNDKIWYVTEKIDGSNVCLSTQGWIASRNNIIGMRGMETCKFQGVEIKKTDIERLFYQMDNLKAKLKLVHLDNVEFELLLYGELILRGTGSSAQDLYNYRKKNRNPGDFYCFGIGLVLPENISLPRIFKNGTLNKEGKENCFLVPMSIHLSQLLTEFDIAHPAVIMSGRLCDILDDEKLVADIVGKEVEGYVLNGIEGEGLLKIKCIENTLDNVQYRERIVKVIEIIEKLN
jgi:hypothetical protein